MAYFELDNVLDHDNVLVYNWNRALRGPKPVYQWDGRSWRGFESNSR